MTQGTPVANDGAQGTPPNTPINTTPPEKLDEWDKFRAAVEDPNVDVYDYIIDRASDALGMKSVTDVKGAFDRSGELLTEGFEDLKDPDKLRARLRSIESNTMLFDPGTRNVVKVARVLLDTYVAVHEDQEKNNGDSKPEDIVRAKLAEEQMEEGFEELSKTFRGKSEQEIADTMHKAVAQMSEEHSVAKFARRSLKFTLELLKPTNVAQIGAIGLAFVSAPYAPIVAGVLMGYCAQAIFFHLGKSLFIRDKQLRKEERAKAASAFKSWCGTFLLMAAAPFVGRMPALMQGFVNLAINAFGNSFAATLENMLKREEKKPGSTPISKNLGTWFGGLLKTHQDTIAKETAKVAAGLSSAQAVKVGAQAATAVPLSKALQVSHAFWELGSSLHKRFNNSARPQVPKRNSEEVSKIKDAAREVKDVHRTLRTEVKKVVVAAKSNPQPTPGYAPVVLPQPEPEAPAP